MTKFLSVFAVLCALAMPVSAVVVSHPVVGAHPNTVAAPAAKPAATVAKPVAVPAAKPVAKTSEPVKTTVPVVANSTKPAPAAKAASAAASSVKK